MAPAITKKASNEEITNTLCVSQKMTTNRITAKNIAIQEKNTPNKNRLEIERIRCSDISISIERIFSRFNDSSIKLETKRLAEVNNPGLDIINLLFFGQMIYVPPIHQSENQYWLPHQLISMDCYKYSH